jgi:hypothetical protein
MGSGIPLVKRERSPSIDKSIQHKITPQIEVSMQVIEPLNPISPVKPLGSELSSLGSKNPL